MFKSLLLGVPMVPFVIALLQFSLAATFLIIPAVAAGRGARAQRAAEHEVARQGIVPTVLTQHRINFGATRGSLVLAAAIGLCFAALGALNLAGNSTGRLLTWIAQPIILVLGCLIMTGEVFVVRGIEAVFRKSGDPAAHRVDVRALVAAAARSFPGWFRSVILARFALATFGSVLVLLLLAA